MAEQPLQHVVYEATQRALAPFLGDRARRVTVWHNVAMARHVVHIVWPGRGALEHTLTLFVGDTTLAAYRLGPAELVQTYLAEQLARHTGVVDG